MPDEDPSRKSLHPVLAGGGEMGARIRAFDWAATPLGPISRWPDSLVTALGLVLNARMPMWLGWGPEVRFFYNDAYVQVLSESKHPWALGRPAAEVWAEIWDVCGPLADQVFRHGEAPFVEDVRLFMDRGDRFEEVFYSFSYSPIRDASGEVAGLFCPNTEVTAKLLHARRLRTLSDLAANALLEKTTAGACASAAATLARNADDVPFALLYVVNEAGDLVLREAVRLEPGASPYAPRAVGPQDGPLPIASTLHERRLRVVEVGLDPALPFGLAGQPVRQVVMLPIVLAGEERVIGVLAAGVNPTRPLDVEYTTFYELVAAQVATALRDAIAAEQERRRLELLDQIDRAKSAFFSNVSHEFRTPLTLMLGPTEDALARPDGALTGESLRTVYRNELRLLKLVNALLDFSRLEAGRMVASYEPVDLGTLTTELASAFRSVVERAGLRLDVRTEPLPGPVAVDRDMWERIVLNLLSNALKFTLEGSIRVALAPSEGWAVLEVADTGTGIPSHELPRVFERFHRVENPRARTQEGSGIGLALVHELVRLHGGTIDVESEVGRGTTFRIRVPLHREAVATNRATARPAAAAAHVQEAERWVPAADEAPALPPVDEGEGYVLVADDNADLRDYLRRLLSEHWPVVVVSDGAAALEAARARPPELVLTDVMMPGIDGFGLLDALKRDERTREVPVILLSARAGDEARVEGLGAGADDYLVKPFSARELVARVRTHLGLARLRRRTRRELDQVFALFNQVPAHILVRRATDLVCVFQNAASLAVRDVRGETDPGPWTDAYRDVLATGRTRTEAGIAAPGDRWFDLTWAPVRMGGEVIDAVMAIGLDVTDRVVARRQAEAAGERLRAALDASAIGTYVWDIRAGAVEHDEGTRRLFGFTGPDGRLDEYTARVHPDDRGAWLSGLARSASEGAPFAQEYRVVCPDGEVRWLLDKGTVTRGEDGAPAVMVGAVVDVTEHKRLAETALEASRAKDAFLAMLGHELRNPLAPIATAVHLLQLKGAASRELSIIDRQVRHITRLVDDLLDLSRVTRGLVELRRQALALGDVVSKALEIASPLVEQRRHRVSVSIPPDLAVVADPVRLAQVFANLLTNAARYTEPGGNLTVSATRSGDRVLARVTDDGRGIRPEELGRIFELFVRGTGGPNEGEGGLGIGLALARSLVRLHGGELTGHSDGPGRGSEFVVELPVGTEGASVAAVAASAEPSVQRRRILLVDDNVDAAEVLSEALRAWGHDVAVANDGPAALGLVRRFRPEVAVLDIGLPVMDGYELARTLRASGHTECRMVALTGYGQDHDRVRSREAGFHAHLVKPVDLTVLAGIVGAVPPPVT